MFRGYRRFVGLALALAALALSAERANAQAQTARAIEQLFASSLTEMPKDELGTTGSFFVPAYSSVAISQGKLRADFSVTLSIHNASETKPLVLKRIAYFETGGRLVESYLKNPIALKPLATIQIYISEADVRGGTGANFIVDWAAAGAIAEPVTEALMIGSVGSGHYAFISLGRAVRPVSGN